MISLSKTTKKQFYLLLFLLMSASFVLVNFIGPDGIRQRIVDGDGSGYYAYLPAVFVYHTVDFDPVFEYEKSQRASDYQGHYFHQFKNIYINKYSCGVALMELPLFLIAYLLSLLAGMNADGYNILFQYSVAMSALIWVFTGLIYLVKLLSLYKIKPTTIFFLILVLFFGTNLFYYTLIAPAASHAYSFALLCIFFYFTKSVLIESGKWKVYLSAFLLGIIMLVRPVNILVVAAVPFLAASPQAFSDYIKQRLSNHDYIPMIILFLLALSPQIIINILQTGQPLVYGYTNEGFYFGNPEVFQFLLSFRKGWFIYTPFMLFLIPSAFYLMKRSVYSFVAFAGFFVVLIYVFSSWWNWFYGDSFGMRPMVDFYGIFLLVIALFFNDFDKNTVKFILGGTSLLFLLLNIFQTYQTATGILHPDSMNYRAYKYIFLKAGSQYEENIADASEYFYGELDKQPFLETENKLEGSAPGWSKTYTLFYIPDSRTPCVEMNRQNVYSPTYTYQIPQQMTGTQNTYIVFNASYFEPYTNAAEASLYVVDVVDTAGKSLFYKSFKVKSLPDDLTESWRKSEIGFKLPLIQKDMATIKLYIWNEGKETFYLKDLKLRFFNYGS